MDERVWKKSNRVWNQYPMKAKHKKTGHLGNEGPGRRVGWVGFHYASAILMWVSRSIDLYRKVAFH